MRSELKLTDFSVSEYQRERDVIVYCYLILEKLGGDGGPMMDTLPGILFRIYKKAQAASAPRQD